MRVGDLALMPLRSESRLDSQTEELIRANVLPALPDPTTDWDEPNGRLWIKRDLLALAIVAVTAGLKSLRRSRLPRRLRRKRKYLFHQAFIPANAVLPRMKNRRVTLKRYPVGFGS